MIIFTLTKVSSMPRLAGTPRHRCPLVSHAGSPGKAVPSPPTGTAALRTAPVQVLLPSRAPKPGKEINGVSWGCYRTEL